MKKLSIFAVALAAVAFAACTGNKTQNEQEGKDSVKSFEQEQIEENIKVQIDSLAAEFGKLKSLPILKDQDGNVLLSDEEKQVKPDYLLSPSAAENAVTLAEKYRTLSALSLDKQIASAYDMPTDEYDEANAKLSADINDPSFKVLDNVGTAFEASSKLYDAMNENGRINYFWQMAASALVEQLYVTHLLHQFLKNTDKFIAAFDDSSAESVTFRIILLQDAIERLAAYDPELQPISDAIEPLKVLNAITVDQFKSQLEECKEEITASRKMLFQ